MELNCHILKSKHQFGYNLLELVLAMAVGSVIIAGTYTANVIVAKQYERLSSYSQVQEMGVPALRLVSRDVRMAGYIAYDSNIESTYGAITTPITITDGFFNSTDSIAIIYDRDTSTRYRTTYYVAMRDAATATTPEKDGLYMDVESWDGSTWTTITSQALVADYIEDLQFEGSDLDGNGNPRFVDIFMVFRSKSLLPNDITYTKPAETAGDWNYSFTDKYNRDEFSATINIKNLR